MFYKYRFHPGLLSITIILLNFVMVMPAISQNNASSHTMIGLSHVDVNEVGDLFGNEQIDKLAIKLFNQLDENSDNSIDSSEFKEWDAKIESMHSATANLFKNITGQQIFEATDIDADTKLTMNEVNALYYFDFISKDEDQNKLLTKDELLSQAPVILRLVSKDCKTINTMYNGMLMGGFCGK